MLLSCYHHIEDKIILGADTSDYFKASSIFRTKEIGPQPLWTKAWIKGLTPKINIFLLDLASKNNSCIG